MKREKERLSRDHAVESRESAVEGRDSFRKRQSISRSSDAWHSPLAPRPSTASFRLRVSGIRKSFGATLALRSVSFELGPGEVHALIGENGAGKSTLMKILSGAHRPDAGTMELDGEQYAPADPQDGRRRGIAMIYQELNLAPHMSAWENIVLGDEPARFGWIDRRESRRRAIEVLGELGHGSLEIDRPAGEFPIAEQQVVEIARALLGSPRVLIMDEPTSSLTHADTDRLFATIARLAARGVSVIYISHFLEECRKVASRYTVLKDGETVAGGPLASDTPLEPIVARMTGRDVRELYPRTERKFGAPVLTLRDVASRGRVRGAGLTLRAGEILGLAGLIGAGRTELVRIAFGLDRLGAGVVEIAGAPAVRPTPRRSWRAGAGFLSEDRKTEGLMLGRSIADNMTLTRLHTYGRGGWIRARSQHAAAARWTGELGIRCRDPRQAAGELSGGNQQKIALARLLEHPARILILDEPTRGIDVGSKALIYELIGRLAADGRAILVVSSQMTELLGLCDTIAVMRRGEMIEMRPRSGWTEESLLRAAIGS